MGDFHFKKLSEGRYQVWSATGFLLGEVWKYEKRYNLRRSFVDRGWRAKSDNGQHRGEFNTRREAAEALLTWDPADEYDNDPYAGVTVVGEEET